MKGCKQAFLLIVPIAVILFCSSAAYSVHGEGPEPDLPGFVSDEIIVKFQYKKENLKWKETLI